jgi:hypothetical protein
MLSRPQPGIERMNAPVAPHTHPLTSAAIESIAVMCTSHMKDYRDRQSKDGQTHSGEPQTIGKSFDIGHMFDEKSSDKRPCEHPKGASQRVANQEYPPIHV